MAEPVVSSSISCEEMMQEKSGVVWFAWWGTAVGITMQAAIFCSV